MIIKAGDIILYLFLTSVLFVRFQNDFFELRRFCLPYPITPERRERVLCNSGLIKESKGRCVVS